jgi:hypothetical protein
MENYIYELLEGEVEYASEPLDLPYPGQCFSVAPAKNLP